MKQRERQRNRRGEGSCWSARGTDCTKTIEKMIHRKCVLKKIQMQIISSSVTENRRENGSEK